MVNLRSTSSAPPKVLFTIFAGRKYHLLFQEPYWLEMYKLGAIHEIHLWDYIPRQEPNGGSTRVYDLNRGYLDSLVKKYDFIKIMDPGDVIMKETYWYDKDHLEKENNVVEWHDDGSAALRYPEKRSFSEYYKYYTDNPWDGVILKADDDILYINSTQVSAFAQYSWDHPEVFFLSASVVNQGLCSHYQQKYGNAIPRELLDLTNLPADGFGESHRSPAHALLVHKHFLASEENRRRFYITEPEYVEFDYSININFFAIRGDQWHETYEVIVEKLKREEEYLDEEAITKNIMQWRGKKEGIYLPLVVAHATYSHQKSVQQEVLTDWANWAKKERSELYGNLLDSWKPPAKPIVKGKFSSVKKGP